MTIDEGSPSSREYDVPFEQARRETRQKRRSTSARGNGSGTTPESTPPPLFGNGISSAEEGTGGSAGSRGVESKRNKGSRSKRKRGASSRSQVTRGSGSGRAETVAPPRSSVVKSSTNGLVWSIMSALGIVAIGLAAAFVVRRRNSPDT